jgi:Flp pilus assembly CpaE family ATPase
VSPAIPLFGRLFSRGQGATASGDALDGVPLLALLDADLRKRVRRKLTRRSIRPGKPLFRQGEPATVLYMVVSGRMRVFLGGERAGTERVLRFVGPGELVGEAAFMADTLHVSSTVAVDDATVVGLARVDFDMLLSDNEGVLRYIAGVVAERQEKANARLAAESAPEDHRAMRGYVSAVYSPRGGSGVTTLAVNIAIALAERHPDDTVLLDLDVLFGHALANLCLEPRGVLAQITPGAMKNLDRAGLEYYLVGHSSSLRVFPGAAHPEQGQTLTGDQVRAAVATLRRNFGHIVLDLPHGFGDVTLAGLESADRVLVLATPEPHALVDIRECQRILHDVLRLPGERITYVLNRPQPYAGLAVAEFAAATASPWEEIAHGGEGPSAAALRGESLMSTRPNNAVVRAASGLADRITSEGREAAALMARPS